MAFMGGSILDLWDADAAQREAFEAAGLDPNEQCGARILVERTPDLSGIYTAKGLNLPGDGALFKMHGEFWVALRAGISTVRKRFAAFHEVAEFRHRHIVHPQIEQFCNAVAGAMAMPRVAFLRAMRQLGDNPHVLAEEFTVTPTAAALRIGEVTQLPLAVLTPSYMWIRGREWSWPDEARIRTEARRRVMRPGLRKIQLEPRRLALAAEDAFETA